MAIAAYTKKLKLSDDNATWKELSAESVSRDTNNSLQENTDLKNNKGFKSRLYGLRDFSLSVEGNFVPYLTYQFNIKRQGISTVFTDEAMTLVSGNTYKITDTAKEIWDRTVLPAFEDNAVPIVDTDIDSIDYLQGTVTFTGAKAGPITVSGQYIPTSTDLCITQASLECTVELEETQNIKTIQTDSGYKSRTAKLKDVSMSVTAFNDLLKIVNAQFNNEEVLLIEILIGDTDIQTVRGWFVIESDNDSGAVADVEMEEVSFQLDGSLESSFSWIYPTTGYDETLKLLTDHVFFGNPLYAQYLPDNDIAKGYTGGVIAEGISLSFDVNGKTTFSTTLQGNGALTDAV